MKRRPAPEVMYVVVTPRGSVLSVWHSAAAAEYVGSFRDDRVVEYRRVRTVQRKRVKR